MNDDSRLRRILLMEIFFLRVADLVASPFNFIAHGLHTHWTNVYNNQKKFRR
jgi:hypothetical protein